MTPYKTTVSTAADSSDLTILASVKSDLGITDTAKDDTLSELIMQASDAVAGYCNRAFAEETLIDSFRLDGCLRSYELLLSRTPISSVSAIVENDVTLTTDDYEFDASSGQIWRLDGHDNRMCWPRGAKVVVTFVAGYALLADLPPRVERACRQLVTAWFYSRNRDPLVKAEDVPGVLSTQYWVGTMPEGSAWPPGFEDLLSDYRYTNV